MTAIVDESGLYEKLAAIEHQRWSDWQRYVHGLCARQVDGSLVIPAEQVARWERQINTDYPDLTEDEKNSDREQVDRYWPLISDEESGGVADASGEPKRSYVEVRVTARNDGELAAFIQLCKTIQHLGGVGASRDIRVAVDGDGSGQMWFDFGNTDTEQVAIPDIEEEIVIGIGE